MTARKTSESATDLRLWCAPRFVVIETVKRLAMTVKTSSTNHERRPARVRKESFTVEIKAEHNSNRPKPEMLPNSSVLFQFLGVFILVGRSREPKQRQRFVSEVV